MEVVLTSSSLVRPVNGRRFDVIVPFLAANAGNSA
ncbi:hypothetical protein Slin14017_G015600 [Septoria linicola]|nr:hypothetical protein Slin14017_G015600 [Septoria linicola]